jgi:voltage-gated potassium channel
MRNPNQPQQPTLESHAERLCQQERSEVLQQWEDWLETPMLVLGFAWLGLFIIELVWGLNPLLEVIVTLIWIVFILDFGIKLLLAPYKISYLRHHWLTAFSLFIPALRTLRIVQVIRPLQSIRAVRGLQLLRVVARINKGMRVLGASIGRRGFGYVVGLTVMITLIGAAGIYAFEHELPGNAVIADYGTALWWTAMVMTTMGSDYYPKTAEGRVLCFLLALYAFAVCGYVTATLATFFVGQDAENDDAELVGAKSIQALKTEITALRTEIQALARRDLDP